MRRLTFIALTLFISCTYAFTQQIGINNPDPLFDLDIRSTDTDTFSQLNLGNADNGRFLRLLSGHNSVLSSPAIMWKNGDSLRFGTDIAGFTEVMRLRSNGTIYLNSLLGIRLNAADMPLITRAWDPFTSGPYTGIGRWGLFMEQNYLTVGIPNIGGRGIQFVTYQPNSGISSVLMRLKEGNLGIGQSDPMYSLDVSGDINLTGRLLTSAWFGIPGQVLTSTGDGPPQWQDLPVDRVAFAMPLNTTMIIPTYVDTVLAPYNNGIGFNDGSHFNPMSGVFTVPSTGIYCFEAKIAWTANSTLTNVAAFIRLLINGDVTDFGQHLARISPDTQYGEDQHYSVLLALNAGDQVSLQVSQSSGSSLNAFANGGSGDTFFAGHKVY